MPARQQTFDLIPTSFATPVPPRPPMTLKAAKKAYAKKSAGPRISKAEQRRKEKKELERQKEKFEREKAANKARAQREKKAEKERREREERKSRGEPEPRKGVRASQMMISRFVRSESAGSQGKRKRKWQEMDVEEVEEDSDETVTDTTLERRNEKEPPAKRVAVVEGDEDEDENEPPARSPAARRNVGFHDSDDEIEAPAKPVPEISKVADLERAVEMPAKKAAVIEDSEDDFGDFPSLSQSDLLAKLDASIPAAERAGPHRASPAGKAADSPYQSSELPRHEIYENDDPFNDSQLLAEMVTTQILSEAAEATLQSDVIEPLPSPAERKVPSCTSRPSHEQQTRERPAMKRTVNGQGQGLSTPTVSKPPLRNGSTNMLPPKVAPDRMPEKPHISSNTFRKSIHDTDPQKVPARPLVNNQELFNVPDQAGLLIKRTVFAPPSATQAFLEEHFDDFFPSPTQQVRELMDDIDGDDPSYSQITRDISPPKAPEKAQSPEKASQPLLPSLPSPVFEDSYFGDLFCTQDLAMSSQEVAELTSPCRPPPPVAPKAREKEPPKPKRRFFEEKEEDLYLAALHESKIQAEKKAQENETPKQHQNRGSRSDMQSFTSIYGDDDILGDEEDTFIQAALNESRLEAERVEKLQRKIPVNPQPLTSREGNASKIRETVQSPASDYGNDDLDLDIFDDDGNTLQGLLREPLLQEIQKRSGYARKVPLREEDAPRTLKRFQSTSSDYGDDEFCGSTQELAALC